LRVGTDVAKGLIKYCKSMDEDSEFRIEIATEKHVQFALLISQTMEESAQARGTGIAKRSPETLINYMREMKSFGRVVNRA
jgi:hypothetical protein